MNACAVRTARQPRLVVGIILIVLVLALVVVSPVPAFACSCAPDPPPDEALAASEAVFAGEVVETRRAGRGQHDDVIARISVDQVWKGEVAATIDVSTAADGAMCGVSFSTGDRWLVYSSERDDGTFETYLCSRTVALEFADEGFDAAGQGDEDLRALGTGSAPGPGEQTRDDPLPWWVWILGAGVLVAGAGGISLRWRQRRDGADTATA